MTTRLTPSAYRGPAVPGYDIDPPLSRIGMISVHTSPLARLGTQDAGGMNLYVRELARHLARQGRTVDIYTRRTDPSTPEVTVDVPGVNVIAVDAGPAHIIPKQDLFDLTGTFADAMLRYMLRNGVRYQVLHAHYWLSGLVAARLKDDLGIPFVQMFHTTAFHKNAVSDEAHRESRLREQMEGRIINVADALIAGNPDERDDLERRRMARDGMVCMVPLGVDLGRFQPGDMARARRDMGLPGDGVLALFVGRIDPIKGIDVLVEAFGRTVNGWGPRREAPRLVLVGGELGDDGQPVGDLARVAADVQDLGISDRVLFLGSRPQEDLATLYQAVDFVVIPSRYESFGLVAIEAMASGTPVIASKVGGLPYSVRDGVAGLLVPATNVVALTNAILDLSRCPDRRAALAVNARVEAARFSWDHVATAMTGVYRSLAARSESPICVAE
ncbi:MAG: Glycosyltransferase MshA involved in mycothiol biosynthesis [uncultured Thermomicrobiales bacterium]|uniref:Glycosyltransferase MshA involved in mycothiol biosynthesis n=1 Tax=uncultured Thermomicrobiales bacterium TaxID=1645740 RepID=A0A6J4UA13_9BACT|nr:MAG: Glycosyltransferase MshA involved in mycothiol biosynthesis [uncultured Thermomicrobiales bacterium]